MFGGNDFSGGTFFRFQYAFGIIGFLYGFGFRIFGKEYDFGGFAELRLGVFERKDS